jgi:hypothetical protein
VITYGDCWWLIAKYATDRVRLLATVESMLNRVPSARGETYRILAAGNRLLTRGIVAKYVVQ